jgi:hypothetical protein
MEGLKITETSNGRPQDYRNLDTKVLSERPSLGSGWFHNIQKGPKGNDFHTSKLINNHQLHCTSFNLILIHGSCSTRNHFWSRQCHAASPKLDEHQRKST